jgi:hypothetical protein
LWQSAVAAAVRSITMVMEVLVQVLVGEMILP